MIFQSDLSLPEDPEGRTGGFRSVMWDCRIGLLHGSKTVDMLSPQSNGLSVPKHSVYIHIRMSALGGEKQII